MPTKNLIRSTYEPSFDEKREDWVVRVPRERVLEREDGSYEVRLPIYLTRTYLSPGGAILRPKMQRYRDWLLAKQGEKCAICGLGFDNSKGVRTLDHQPPISQQGSKFIDYELHTQNRVIHQSCDKAQIPKRSVQE